MIENCPHCGAKIVKPTGRSKSSILLVGEVPGEMDCKLGVPWTGKGGDVLRAELDRAGFNFNACRATNLWLHAKPKSSRKPEEQMQARACFDWCLENLLNEMAKSRAVLLMGSELAPLIIGHKVSKINGAVIRETLIPLPSRVEVLIASYSPGICLSESGVVGDFRFAIQQFVEHSREIYKESINAK